jgi:DNA-binding phage protein
MDHEARMQAAITDLKSQTRKNYASIARKWDLERTTLARRFRGETGPNQDAISYAHKQLTDTQEKILIKYINKLSDRGLLLTP